MNAWEKNNTKFDAIIRPGKISFTDFPAGWAAVEDGAKLFFVSWSVWRAKTDVPQPAEKNIFASYKFWNLNNKRPRNYNWNERNYG